MAEKLDKIAGHILFVSYGGGHAAALAPIVLAMRSQEHPVTVLALTTAAHYYAEREIETIGMGDLVDAVDGYERARQVGEGLSDATQSHPHVTFEETCAYMGVGYIGLEQEFSASEAKRIYSRSNRQAFRPTHFFEQMYEAARPLAIVATSAPRSERAALEAARNLQIPSVCIVDLNATFEIKWCASPSYASQICVLNEAVKQRFVDHGVPPEKIHATGNPAFDRLRDVRVDQVRKSYRAQLGLGDDDRLLVWISQPEPATHPLSGLTSNPDLPMDIERSLAAAFADDLATHIVCRLHPSEKREPTIRGERIRYSSTEEPLDPLLCAADCILTRNSSVGIEAAMLSKPVVQIAISPYAPDLPLAEMGHAKLCHDMGATVEAVKEAFATARSDKTMVQAGAAGKIAKICTEILS